MNNVKETIAKNLAELRKSHKFTQQTLAEKLDYSDKAVSRWEHGETLPDIETLCKICDIYGVKFEYLLQEEQPKGGKNPYLKKNETKLAQVMIALITVCAVWVMASVAYTYTYASYNLWILFIWALPLTGLVLSICNKMWGKNIFGAFISSFTSWTAILSLFLTFVDKRMWALFLVGVPIQLIIIFVAILNKSKSSAQTVKNAKRKDKE
jgi:transcriptional regulator with XRE-family HTH domain